MSNRTCSVCGRARRLVEVLAVIGPGGRRYVCRPTVHGPGCFRAVKGSERIELPRDPRNAA